MGHGNEVGSWVISKFAKRGGAMAGLEGGTRQGKC